MQLLLTLLALAAIVRSHGINGLSNKFMCIFMLFLVSRTKWTFESCVHFLVKFLVCMLLFIAHLWNQNDPKTQFVDLI